MKSFKWLAKALSVLTIASATLMVSVAAEESTPWWEEAGFTAPGGNSKLLTYSEDSSTDWTWSGQNSFGYNEDPEENENDRWTALFDNDKTTTNAPDTERDWDAWDEDYSTLYVQVQLDEPMKLTQIALCPVQWPGFTGVLNGMVLEGSTDGETWTTLYQFSDVLTSEEPIDDENAEVAPICITADQLQMPVGKSAYTYFRLTETDHILHAAELALWAEPATDVAEEYTGFTYVAATPEYFDLMGDYYSGDDYFTGWNTREVAPDFPESVREEGFPTFATDYEGENTVVITGYVGGPVPQNLIIPGKIEAGDTTYKVVGVASYAFHDMEFESVTLEEGVLALANEAFGATPIGTLTIPSTMRYLSGWSTGPVETLVGPSYEDLIKKYGDELKAKCGPRENSETGDWDEWMVLDYRLWGVVSVNDGILYAGGTNAIIRCATSKTDDTLVIPYMIDSVGAFAFQDAQIKHVVLPISLHWIDYRAFHASALEEIVLPPNVLSVGSETFYECNNLTKVTILGNYIGNDKLNSYEEDYYLFGLPEGQLEVVAYDNNWGEYFAKLNRVKLFYDRTDMWYDPDLPGDDEWLRDEIGMEPEELYSPADHITFTPKTAPDEMGWYIKPIGADTALLEGFGCDAEVLSFPETVELYGTTYKIVGIENDLFRLRSHDSLWYGEENDRQFLYSDRETVQTITIPEGYTGCSVDQNLLVEWIFCDLDKLETVNLPSTVTAINTNIFAEDDILKTVNYAGKELEIGGWLNSEDPWWSMRPIPELCIAGDCQLTFAGRYEDINLDDPYWSEPPHYGENPWFTIRYTSPVIASVQTIPDSVEEGGTATLTVETPPTGNEPYSYQWYKDGEKITGATEATYQYETIGETDGEHTFYVVVTDKNGNSTTSETVTVIVVTNEHTVNEAKDAVDGAFVEVPFGSTDEDIKQAVSNKVESILGEKCIGGIRFDITVNSDGTATVKLSKGEVTSEATVHIIVGTDPALSEWEKAQDAFNKAVFNDMRQNEVEKLGETEEEITAKLADLMKSVAEEAVSNSNVTVTVETVKYVAAEAGSAGAESNRDGKNGSYEFKVTLTMEDTAGNTLTDTWSKSIVIYAEKYSMSVEELAAAAKQALDNAGRTLLVEPGMGAAEKYNAVCSFVKSSFDNVGIVEGYDYDDIQVTDNGNGTYTIQLIREGKAVYKDTVKVEEKPSTSPEPDFDYNYWIWSVQQLRNRTFTVTATAGEGGTITPDGTTSVKYEKSQTYTITPDEGYAIHSVTVDGISQGAISTYTFRGVKANHTISAEFEKIAAEPAAETTPAVEAPTESTPAVEPTTTEETAWENPFTDVSEADTYYKAVEFVCENGLFNGISSTEFAPATTMTRAMFVTVLGRLAGVDTTTYSMETTFEDVVPGEWYAPYVAWAAENGIVNGYSTVEFGVDDEITVEQAAVILARYAAYAGIDTTATATLDAYTDAADVSAWAVEAVTWAVESEIYTGTDESLNSTTPAARSLVAEMMYNYITVFGE